jgi:hypothetical protein
MLLHRRHSRYVNREVLMETEIKKTGATPIIEEGVGGGEVLGVVEVKHVMIKLRDGHGKDMVKLAFVIPGGDVYFLEEKVIGKPAQQWVRNAVLKALGLKA